MKKKFLATCLSVFFLGCYEVGAISPADYKDRFVVDMNADIPPIDELRKMFAPKPVYDRKFDYFWTVGKVFDKEFAQTIKNYGMRQTRLKWQG